MKEFSKPSERLRQWLEAGWYQNEQPHRKIHRNGGGDQDGTALIDLKEMDGGLPDGRWFDSLYVAWKLNHYTIYKMWLLDWDVEPEEATEEDISVILKYLEYVNSGPNTR